MGSVGSLAVTIAVVTIIPMKLKMYTTAIIMQLSVKDL